MNTRGLALLFVMIFSFSCNSQSVEEDIVLVNTGPYDKGRIARLISEVNLLNPKVIALDIALPEYTGNYEDESLYEALANSKRLIMPSEIHYQGRDYYGKEMISVALTCAMEFFPIQAKAGFVSVKIEERQTQIPKQFIVWQEGYTGDVYHHFSVLTAMALDSLKTSRFIQGHERLAEVDYKNGKRKFKTLSGSDVLSGKLTKNDIEGKIVMMGFLGPGDVDKFFTPLSTNPNEPDMYGVEYLANIVAQVLEYDKD